MGRLYGHDFKTRGSAESQVTHTLQRWWWFAAVRIGFTMYYMKW